MVRSPLVKLVDSRCRAQRDHQRRRRLAWKIVALLRVRMTLRVRNYLTSNVLISPSQCPWATTYRARDDGAFINTVSLPVAAFEMLLLCFSRHYIVRSGPGKRGRPPRMYSKNNVLACILHFYTAAVELKTPCELFGVVPSTMSRVSRKAELALRQSLKELPEARVQWTTFKQQREWATYASRKEPLIKGCFCVADGKNYVIQAPSASDWQNAYYNGWLHAVKVTGVLCHGFDETLIWGRHNHPGSWNDGEMSHQLQNRLANPNKTMQGGRCATWQEE